MYTNVYQEQIKKKLIHYVYTVECRYFGPLAH